MHGEEVMENNYQLSRIHNYITGLMNEEEMYQMERDALEDPFLQDAIDGYKLQQGVDSRPLSILQQRLARRLEEQSYDKSRRFYSWQRLAIGMAAGVLFLVVCSLIFFNHLNEPRTVRNNDVLLMEEELRVHTTVGSDGDVVPDQGWDQFNEELNSELRDFSRAGMLTIEFQVNQGKIREIQVLDSSDPELTRVVSEFLKQKVVWRGSNGNLTFHIEP